MLRHYFTIALRNLWKHRIFSGINLLGLSVGMASFLLIFSYVSFERSYDNYNTKADRIYRITCDTKTETEVLPTGLTAGPTGQAIKTHFPEVEEQARICYAAFLVQNGIRRFQEDKMLMADPSLFAVFTLPFVKGDPATALKDPFSVVLSEAGARKYFGAEDPMGRALVLEGKYTFNVTGLMKDIPENSQFHGDILLSMSTFSDRLNKGWDVNWGGFNWFTFLLLKPGADAQRLEARLPAFVKEQAADVEKATGMSYTLHLQSLRSVYLGPNLNNYGQGEPTGSMTSVNIFSIVGIFILVIACINFVNITTARASERAKEVGIRKAIGAVRGQLTLQFLGESILLCLIAFAVAVGLCNVLHPVFIQLLGKNIPLSASGSYIGTLFAIALGIGLLAGIYPALVMSGFNPIVVLKSRFVATKTGLTMRQLLVVFQFTISTALIIGIIVVYQQLKFMQSQDLGFKKDQVMAVDFHGDSAVQSNIEFVRQEFLHIPNVKAVSFSSNVPGTTPNNWYLKIANPSGAMQGANLNFYVIDFDYFHNYGIQIKAGRAFSRTFTTDSTEAIVLNEAAARSLGYADPVKALGAKYSMWGVNGTITGIARDFHYRSLQEEIQPLAFRVLHPGSYNMISLTLSGDRVRETVAAIGEKWKALVPDRPFQYSFVEEDFEHLYASEDQFQRVFQYFGLLAIFISCLGLLGLASYSTVQRTKEIGIRKVLGASVATIIRLLSREFLSLVFIALLIASPVAWFFMHNWLGGFAYRTSIAWWVFPLAAGTAVLITFLTVGFHSIKAAIADPAKSLKTE